MDWNTLLADLENRFEAEHRADLVAEAADLAEAERATVLLVDRLRAALGTRLRVRTCSGALVEGVLRRVEDELVLIDGGAGEQNLVATSALATVDALPGPAPAPVTARRPGMGAALRELARRGNRVRLTLTGLELSGRIMRVGKDHLDLLPDGAGQRSLVVPLARVEMVSSR